MAFRSVTGSFHWYPAAVQLLDSLSAQLQLKEEQLIFADSSQHGGGGGSCGDVAVCSVFNLTATPSDHQSQWIADQKLLVSAAKIVCNSEERTITKVVVDLEAAAAAAQQQETVEPTGRNFGWTADFFYGFLKCISV